MDGSEPSGFTCSVYTGMNSDCKARTCTVGSTTETCTPPPAPDPTPPPAPDPAPTPPPAPTSNPNPIIVPHHNDLEKFCPSTDPSHISSHIS